MKASKASGSQLNSRAELSPATNHQAFIPSREEELLPARVFLVALS
jgi:hypothetical protein